jgi:hypothetical protein
MVSEGDHKDRVDLFPLHLTEPSVIKAREIARTGSRCDSQSFVRTPRGCLAGPVAHTRLAYQPPCSILLITVEFPFPGPTGSGFEESLALFGSLPNY